jgi:putative exosortase-associated protein (TIGR04073 family)
MKRLLFSIAVALIASQAVADIQDPPLNANTPTRKLGRGIANLLWSSSEIFESMERVNDMDGNAAAWSTGIVRGINRHMVRMGTGVYEIVTYPFPTHKMSYRPALRAKVPWINNGYEEYPPEFGFETRKTYCTVFQKYTY